MESNFINMIFKLPEFNDKTAYQQFKKWGENYTSEEILKDLRRYSKYYYAFVQKDETYSQEINNFLGYFRQLKQTTIFPLFFALFDDLENAKISEKTLLNVLSFFINYTIRRFIVGAPTQSLRGLYRSLYKRIFDENTEITEMTYEDKIYQFMGSLNFTANAVPSDVLFKEKLITENIYKNKPLCRFLLSVLENGLDISKESVMIDEKISIEHVLPQNEDNIEWQRELGDNYSYVYSKYLHTLGNLTLTGYNSELSDKPFSEKVKQIRLNSKFQYLNMDIVDKNTWNEDTITKRADRLSNKFLEVFNGKDASIHGLYCKAVVEEINKRIKVKLLYKGKNNCFTDDDPLLKSKNRESEIFTYLKKNCLEGYNNRFQPWTYPMLHGN